MYNISFTVFPGSSVPKILDPATTIIYTHPRELGQVILAYPAIHLQLNRPPISWFSHSDFRHHRIDEFLPAKPWFTLMTRTSRVHPGST
jgi:hypothetical protein